MKRIARNAKPAIGHSENGRRREDANRKEDAIRTSTTKNARWFAGRRSFITTNQHLVSILEILDLFNSYLLRALLGLNWPFEEKVTRRLRGNVGCF